MHVFFSTGVDVYTSISLVFVDREIGVLIGILN